ncbi:MULTISPECIES: flagellar hook assembly protein FlgD [Methylotenera]|uniref:flagellar hook assembly protein FlgD n=1 Tax=Methylotenera TaxID=359407 RepID=UPI00035FD0FA|nr:MULTISPECIES: flagellar hook assembly protein FlgD [Methylotenera]
MTTIQNNTVSQTLLNTMNPAKTAASAADAAQDRFMTLLVTQMKNQDPLNPMDNAQMTSQLAQLSTVTGIDKLNNTMQSLISNVQSSQTFQATGMIGRNVMVPGNSLWLSENASYFGVDLPADVDQLTVSIKDAAGSLVKEVNLGPQKAGILPLSWNGFNDAGNSLNDGKYTFEVNAKVAGQSASATSLSYDQVVGINNGSLGIELNLQSLGTVNMSQIKQIQN